MPTKAFYELDADKKQILIEAAIQEFASLPYEKVSMFKIAQNAGVSRSGLYYYFKDKDDIYRYITEQMFKPFLKRIREKPRLDPFALSRDFFIFFARYKNTEREALLRQTLYNARSMDMETMISHIRAVRSEKEFGDLASLVDLSSLKVSSADELMTLFVLVQTVSVRLLFALLDNDLSFDKALEQLDRTFNLLRYGFMKEQIPM